MTTLRVYEVAEEFGLETGQLIHMLREMDILVRSHMSTVEPSHVLQALGVEARLLHNSIRIGLGRYTTEAEIDIASDELAKAVRSLRASIQVYERT